MNPEIDIGQVEGAFIMGLGYWLTEQAIYDPTTGLQLNTGTWVCDSLELQVLNLKSVLDYRSAQWRSQPDIWSCKCTFFSVYRAYKESISKEIHYDVLNLHSMAKLSGWLRYWQCFIYIWSLKKYEI